MDGHDETPLDSFCKVDNLWFEDADVVFCAGKSKFRVYRGILSAQSTEFRNMFMLPPDSEGAAKTQNTILVIDLPDDESDVRYFFLGIFDPSFYMPPPSQYDLEVTVSILRLSQKYKVPFLIQRAISHLDSIFPIDFTSIMESLSPVQKNSSEKNRLLKCYLEILPLAINARARWITPSVLYLMNLRYHPETIITHSSFGHLPSTFQAVIVKSCVNNALEESHDNTWVGMLPAENCEKETQCALVSRMVQTLCRNSSQPIHWNVKMKIQDGKMFCRRCQPAGKKAQEEIEGRYWEQYAIVCGFKSWEEVIKLRSRDMAGSS